MSSTPFFRASPAVCTEPLAKEPQFRRDAAGQGLRTEVRLRVQFTPQIEIVAARAAKPTLAQSIVPRLNGSGIRLTA